MTNPIIIIIIVIISRVILHFIFESAVQYFECHILLPRVIKHCFCDDTVIS